MSMFTKLDQFHSFNSCFFLDVLIKIKTHRLECWRNRPSSRLCLEVRSTTITIRTTMTGYLFKYINVTLYWVQMTLYRLRLIFYLVVDVLISIFQHKLMVYLEYHLELVTELEMELQQNHFFELLI